MRPRFKKWHWKYPVQCKCKLYKCKATYTVIRWREILKHFTGELVNFDRHVKHFLSIFHVRNMLYTLLLWIFLVTCLLLLSFVIYWFGFWSLCIGGFGCRWITVSFKQVAASQRPFIWAVRSAINGERKNLLLVLL